MFKFECRKFSISFGKQYANNRAKGIEEIISVLHTLLDNPSPSDEDKQKLYSLQEKFYVLYLKKTKGAFVRSRAKWLTFGGKSSAYFFSVEKNAVRQKIFVLSI